MKYKLFKTTTSKLLPIFIQNTTSVTGSGLTGLTYASSGLSWYYLREGAATPVAVTLADMTVGTWASGGFKEIDATNMPGFYQVGVPNAAIATGANSVSMVLRGATNMVPRPLEIELDAINYQDTVRLGLTALPNAADGAAGGLTTIIGANATPAQVATALINYDATIPADLSILATPAQVASALTTAAIPAGVWAVGTRALTDKAGFALTSAYDLAKTAAAPADVATALTNYAGAKPADIGTALTAYTAAKAGDAMALTSGERTTLAASIWNALTSGMSTMGSVGKLLADNITASLANLPGNFWNRLLSIACTEGSIGEKIFNWIPGKVISYDTGKTPAYASDVAAIIPTLETTLANISVTIVSPLTSTGNTLSIMRGDSYALVHGWGGIVWPTRTGIPDLTDATITFECGAVETSIDAAGNPTDGYEFTATFTGAETDAMRAGDYNIIVTWGSDRITAIRGEVEYL